VRRNPDIALAQKLLGGWTPQVPLERGLEATIAYFRGLNGRPQVAPTICGEVECG
jgi:nucleoside-diphosphate-sugar epimerase